MWLTESLNPLPYLEPSYLQLALVCKQWRAFLKRQDSDYVTLKSVGYQSLGMFQILLQEPKRVFFNYIAKHRPLDLEKYNLKLQMLNDVDIATSMLQCHVKKNNVRAVVDMIKNYPTHDINIKEVVRMLVANNMGYMVSLLGIPLVELLNIGIENGKYFEYAQVIEPEMSTLIAAANAGNERILEHAMSFVSRNDVICDNIIIKSDNINAVDMLQEYEFDEDVWISASAAGEEETIRWAVEHERANDGLNRDFIESFMLLGNQVMVTWLVERYNYREEIEYKGHEVAIFDHLFQNDCPWELDNLEHAVREKNNILCDWLMAHGAVYKEETPTGNFYFDTQYFEKATFEDMLHVAIKTGDLQYVKWIMRRDSTLMDGHLDSAASADQLHILEWLDRKYSIANRLTRLIMKTLLVDNHDESGSYYPLRVLRWILQDPYFDPAHEHDSF